MKKGELVFAEILSRAAEGKRAFTQQGIAGRLHLSLSTVNAATKALEGIGAVQVKPRSAVLLEPKKALLYWASHRQLSKDIVYSTRADATPREIERNMPSGTIFTAYTAYQLLYGETPADYSEVYAYSDDVGEIRKRFPPRKGPQNLFILKKAAFPSAKNAVTPPHLYVDLWNLREWYAKEYLEALELKLNEAFK